MPTFRKNTRENEGMVKQEQNARRWLFNWCLSALLLNLCIFSVTISQPEARSIFGLFQGMPLDAKVWYGAMDNANKMLLRTGRWWLEHARFCAESALTIVDKHVHHLPGMGERKKVLLRKNAMLETRLQALIEEAKRVAEEQGIFTEAGAAERRKERQQREKGSWGYLLSSSKEDWLRDKLSHVTRRVCSGEDTFNQDNVGGCGARGVCVEGACRCAVAYSGIVCGHSKFVMAQFTESVSRAGVPLGYAGHFIRRQDVSKKNGFLVQHLDDGYLYGQCSLAVEMESVQKGNSIGEGVLRASQERGDDLLIHLVLGTEMQPAMVYSHAKGGTANDTWMPCSNPVYILLREEGIEDREKTVAFDAEFQRHVGDLFPHASGEESERLLISTVIMSLNICRKVSFMVRAVAVDAFLHQAKTQYYGMLYSLLASDIVNLSSLE